MLSLEMMNSFKSIFEQFISEVAIFLVLYSQFNAQDHILNRHTTHIIDAFLISLQITYDLVRIFTAHLKLIQYFSIFRFLSESRNVETNIEAIHNIHLLKNWFQWGGTNDQEFTIWIRRLLLNQNQQSLQDSIRETRSNMNELNESFNVIKNNQA